MAQKYHILQSSMFSINFPPFVYWYYPLCFVTISGWGQTICSPSNKVLGHRHFNCTYQNHGSCIPSIWQGFSSSLERGQRPFGESPKNHPFSLRGTSPSSRSNLDVSELPDISNIRWCSWIEGLHETIIGAAGKVQLKPTARICTKTFPQLTLDRCY